MEVRSRASLRSDCRLAVHRPGERRCGHEPLRMRWRSEASAAYHERRTPTLSEVGLNTLAPLDLGDQSHQ